ncbi:MAG: biotin/lipoyl-binding protein [Clostridium sp.]|nr:biotin/lipoyl-binding protein [Clostridium sp.]
MHAGRDGKVSAVAVSNGQAVQEGETLITID